ncbi:hypothetical protein TRICI_005871 [Trichomonascus ciferrii]|uniref:CWH43-like N-terminal domain-containing protein n=1 Tax=Trichomonascus ciferrii TaxID=44093 RepID=A0A642UTC8_9ASCO|nr:hypothetical protein TRICI_005871 [Trichomonascus ciferrii]
MWKVLHHWGLPLFGCICWWGMLIALMVCWAVQGHPRYYFVNPNKDILFISDVAATNLQPIFIALCCVQALCYVLTVISERYLRHAGRLLPNWRQREKVMAGLAIGFGIIGQLGIVFVSIFNTHVFKKVHASMLGVFLVGTAISALCTIAEFALLDWSYTEVNRLRISYICKGCWFVVALALTLGFLICQKVDKENAAAVMEWCLAFSYGFYLMTLVYDLLPAAKTKKGQLFEQKLDHQLTNAVSWVPGVQVLPEEPSINPSAEMRENNSSHVGENIMMHRQSHPRDFV